MGLGSNPTYGRGGKKRAGVPVWRANASTTDPVTWSEVKPALMVSCIVAVTGGGAAIMFGRTSDSGALSLCVLDQDTKAKEYPHTVAEAEALLINLAEFFQDRMQM